MAAFLAFLPQMLEALGAGASAAAPAAVGAGAAAAAAPAAAGATPGIMSGLAGLLGHFAQAAPYGMGPAAPATGLAGLLSQAPGALKSVGSGLLNNAAPINNLMGAANQFGQMANQQPPVAPPIQPHPMQPSLAPFGGVIGQPPTMHQVPQPGGIGSGAPGLAGLGIDPQVLLRLLQGGGL